MGPGPALSSASTVCECRWLSDSGRSSDAAPRHLVANRRLPPGRRSGPFGQGASSTAPSTESPRQTRRLDARAEGPARHAHRKGARASGSHTLCEQRCQPPSSVPHARDARRRHRPTSVSPERDGEAAARAVDHRLWRSCRLSVAATTDAVGDAGVDGVMPQGAGGALPASAESHRPRAWLTSRRQALRFAGSALREWPDRSMCFCGKTLLWETDPSAAFGEAVPASAAARSPRPLAQRLSRERHQPGVGLTAPEERARGYLVRAWR